MEGQFCHKSIPHVAVVLSFHIKHGFGVAIKM